MHQIEKKFFRKVRKFIRVKTKKFLKKGPIAPFNTINRIRTSTSIIKPKNYDSNLESFGNINIAKVEENLAPKTPKISSNNSFKSSNKIKHNSNKSIKTEEDLSKLLDNNKKKINLIQEKSAEKKQKKEKTENKIRLDKLRLENSIMYDSKNDNKNIFYVSADESITSIVDKKNEKHLNPEIKQKIFKIHVEKTIHNIELMMDLRNDKILEKKEKMQEKINKLFLGILIDFDVLFTEILAIHPDELYQFHFQNLFDYKKENKTFQGK